MAVKTTGIIISSVRNRYTNAKQQTVDSQNCLIHLRDFDILFDRPVDRSLCPDYLTTDFVPFLVVNLEIQFRKTEGKFGGRADRVEIVSFGDVIGQMEFHARAKK